MTNKFFVAAFSIVLLSSCTKHISNEDKVSYLVGHQVGETMKRQGLTINPKIAAQAIADALNDKNKMEPKDYEEAVAAVQQAVNSKLISDQEANAKKAVACMKQSRAFNM
jgi:FKBP-type peptidyl-prolyl cis-trans isomerase